MFNKWTKRFAYEFEGDPQGWEQGPLPWMRHRHHHHFEAEPQFQWRGRRGPGGPGGPGGHRGPFGSEGRRFFGRGDVKFALLELLQERPMHGYEMMKALEERSGGFYAPSAGTIYPTLQLLEDRELVTVQEVEGKKVYQITDAGRALLHERQEEEGTHEGPPWMRGGFGQRWNAPEFQALRSEAAEVARLFTIAGRTSFRDPQKIDRLRSILSNARKDLNDLIYNESTPQDPQTPPTPEKPAE